jgi:hypothetical protein
LIQVSDFERVAQPGYDNREAAMVKTMTIIATLAHCAGVAAAAAAVGRSLRRGVQADRRTCAVSVAT